jgi:hypothetical protein
MNAAHGGAADGTAVHEPVERVSYGRRVADHQAARRVRDHRVPALEDGAQLRLLELGRRVHRRDVGAAAAEDAEVAEAAALAVERDAVGAKRRR